MSQSCGIDSQNRRSLKEFRGDHAVVREAGARSILNMQSDKQAEVNMVDAGMYAAASFAILLISGVAARKLFTSTGLNKGEFGGDSASKDVSLKGSDGDDGLDNVRKRRP